MSSSHAQRVHLQEAAGAFDVGMLITRDGADVLHARPMTIVSERGNMEEILLVTSSTSAPAQEIAEDGRTSLVMQSTSAYVHLSGVATVFADEALAKDLWKPAWRVWFPDGATALDLVFISFVPIEGEFWDASMVASLRYLFDQARSLVSRDIERGSGGSKVHARVEL